MAQLLRGRRRRGRFRRAGSGQGQPILPLPIDGGAVRDAADPGDQLARGRPSKRRELLADADGGVLGDVRVRLALGQVGAEPRSCQGLAVGPQPADQPVERRRVAPPRRRQQRGQAMGVFFRHEVSPARLAETVGGRRRNVTRPPKSSVEDNRPSRDIQTRSSPLLAPSGGERKEAGGLRPPALGNVLGEVGSWYACGPREEARRVTDFNAIGYCNRRAKVRATGIIIDGKPCLSVS